MSSLHPRKEVLVVALAALAATVDASRSVAKAPFDGAISKVSYVPDAAITGANTDTRTLSVKNRGAAGAGTTVVASLALTNGVNATAFDEKAITLSGTAGNLVVAAGDVLSFESAHAGTGGLADPGGLIAIEFTRS